MRGELEVSSVSYTLGYKRSWKQRLRDWLNDSGEEKVRQDIYVDESPSIDSDKGIRFNVYQYYGSGYTNRYWVNLMAGVEAQIQVGKYVLLGGSIFQTSVTNSWMGS